jgi:hypothetical protein
MVDSDRVITNRVIAYSVLIVIGVIFAIAATPAVSYTARSDQGHVRFTVWRTCFYNASQPEVCVDSATIAGCATNLVKATRALDIATILILTFFCSALALIDLYSIVEPEVAPYLLAFGAGVASFSSLLAFGINLSLWSNECHGRGLSIQDAPGSSIGPAPFLMAITWLMTVIMVAVSLLVKGRGKQRRKSVHVGAGLHDLMHPMNSMHNDDHAAYILHHDSNPEDL